MVVSVISTLRKHKYNWAIYLPVIVVLDVLLLFYTFCLGPVLIALATFAIPYFFYVRDIKKLFLIGTMVLLIISVISAGVNTYIVYTYFGAVNNEKFDGFTALSENDVNPHVGGSETNFTFSVTVTTLNNITQSVKLYLSNDPRVLQNLSALIVGVNTICKKYYNMDLKKLNRTEYENDLNQIRYEYSKFEKVLSETKKNQKVYELICRNVTERDARATYSYATQLYPDNYFYLFIVEQKKTVAELSNLTMFGFSITEIKHGPVNTDKIVFFSACVVQFVFYVMLFIGLIFYVLLGIYWWIGRARREREKFAAEVEKDIAKEKKELTNAVSRKGPSKKEVEYTCSSCGASVKEEDKKCWKCGEPFEN